MPIYIIVIAASILAFPLACICIEEIEKKYEMKFYQAVALYLVLCLVIGVIFYISTFFSSR